MKSHRAEWFFLLLMLLPILLFLILGITPKHADSLNTDAPCAPVGIVGEYSVDGGEWHPIGQELSLPDGQCTNVSFRGHLTKSIPKGQYLILSMRNLWVQLRINGVTATTNRFLADGTPAVTPGYAFAYVPADAFTQDAFVELVLDNPYPYYQPRPFADALEQICIGTRDALYAQMIHQEGLAIVLSLVLCSAGTLAFILMSAIHRRELYRFVPLVLMIVCAQFYLVKESVYRYLPLFILNPVLCMAADVSTLHFSAIASILYIFSCLRDVYTRRFMACTLGLAIAASSVSVILQLTGVWDLYPSQLLLFPAIALGCVGGMICLYMEALMWKNNNAKLLLISLAPLMLSVIVELFNRVVKLLPNRSPVRFGVLAAMVIQLMLLVVQTIRMQRERRRYQAMEAELVRSQTAIILSQIQPHFLYNALSAIAQLCSKNPTRAKEATIAFSEFLRGNMKTLKSQQLVSFRTELEHLNNYLKLEKMRFEDALTIVLDIQTSDFMLPPLTVQPLVENAVKYGIGMKEDGGTVTIASRRCQGGFEITITDDGVGYDPSQVRYDGRTHIGIENVRQRLETMCYGTLTIQSVKDEGTKAVIRIPRHINEAYRSEMETDEPKEAVTE